MIQHGNLKLLKQRELTSTLFQIEDGVIECIDKGCKANAAFLLCIHSWVVSGNKETTTIEKLPLCAEHSDHGHEYHSDNPGRTLQ